VPSGKEANFRVMMKTDISKRTSNDSSVGIALGYGLDDRGSRVRFPAGVGNFSLHHRVQNGSGSLLSNGYQEQFPRG
jgi:hypothetical protein